MLRRFMKYSWLLMLIVFTSCSLFDGMRKNSFVYDDGQMLRLNVPKGYNKVELKTDSQGNKTRLFSYGNGGTLYFHYGDTTKEYQALDTSMHIPKFYPVNVKFYKAKDSSSGLFWRESRYKNFRFGYKNISTQREGVFDSAINYAAWQVIQK